MQILYLPKTQDITSDADTERMIEIGQASEFWNQSAAAQHSTELTLHHLTKQDMTGFSHLVTIAIGPSVNKYLLEMK